MDFSIEQEQLTLAPETTIRKSQSSLHEDIYSMNSENASDKKGSNLNAGSDNTKVQSIGEAWLEKDGGITLSLRSDAYGAPISAMFTYKTNDRDYAKILKHLGGLKPGEVKDVPPFPDKNE